MISMRFTTKASNMKITIEFDSCWQTSFLSDDEKKSCDSQKSNVNKPNANGYMQKFVATSKSRGETPSPITDDTVLGVLCRLIGYQQKLYSLKERDDFYFRDIQSRIKFNLKKTKTTDELLYVTNKSDDRCGKGTWLGCLENDNPWFSKNSSQLLWSILYLNKDELLNFILSSECHTPNPNQQSDLKPKVLIDRLEIISNSKATAGQVFLTKDRINVDRNKIIKKLDETRKKKQSELKNITLKPLKTEKQKSAHLSKLTKLDNSIVALTAELNQFGTDTEIEIEHNKLMAVITRLGQEFPNEIYLEKEGVKPIRLYAAALYLQVNRMIKEGFDFSFVKKKKDGIQIQGFSKRGFNGIRDWLNIMAGDRKKQVGTPCTIQKQTGILEIEVELDKVRDTGVLPDTSHLTRAQEISQLIENAGVSSFYLGKKGLAYVSKIRI